MKYLVIKTEVNTLVEEPQVISLLEEKYKKNT